MHLASGELVRSASRRVVGAWHIRPLPRRVSAVLIALAGTFSANVVPAAEVESIARALSEAKPIVEMRLRLESVSQEGIAANAEALTLRGRVGMETGHAWNTALLAEGEFLWPLVSNYDSTVNGKHRYPVIADPENYQINRLQLTNVSIPNTAIVLGRQRIVLDDQRFIANVAWRQNEQTYDALRVTTKPRAPIVIDFAYIEQVNRVFGRDSAVGRYHGDNYAIDVGYELKAGTLTAFTYLLDFKEAPADSTSTFGARFAGASDVRSVRIGYSGSWARQSDRGRNPLSFAEDYYALEVSGSLRALTLTGGVETLEGNGIKGFTTPLATLHKFQGWADKFLTTPPNGVVDRYVSLGWTTGHTRPLDTLGMAAIFHTFDAERIALRYGSELDLQLEAKLKRVRAVLKYAAYDTTHFATDTAKYWAQVEFVL